MFSMELDFLTNLVNSALCCLIWVIQLVVYPGFCYYSEADIKQWHKIYTFKITLIVLPLMLSQLCLYSYSLISDISSISIIQLALVLVIWLITFLLAVPLHHKIDLKKDSLPERQRLVRINWSRTILWTLILIISILYYEK